MADKNFGVKQINLIGASGTPTIESPNNININAVNVAISTDMTVGGTVGISSNVTITGLVTATTFTGQLSGNLRLADNAGDVLVVGSGIGQTSQLYNTNLYDSLGRAITNVTADQVHFAGDADGLIGSPDIAVTNVTAGIVTATTGFAGNLRLADNAGNVLVVGSGIGQTSQLYNTNLYDSLGRAITNVTADQIHFAGDADGLIGSPDIAVTNVTAGIVTATTGFAGNLRLADNAGDVLVVGSGVGQTSQLYNTNLYDSLGRAITNVTADQVHFAGDADGLIGSPDITVTNITAGIVTATKFAGDGSELTGVSSESLDVFVRSKSTGNIVGRTGNIALRPVAITVTSNTIDVVPRSGSDITVTV